MDRWLVGLARLPAPSASRRLLIGIGIALGVLILIFLIIAFTQMT